MNLKKAIGFARRSTDRQDMSIQDQKTMISEWMKTSPVIAEEGIDPILLRFVEWKFRKFRTVIPVIFRTLILAS